MTTLYQTGAEFYSWSIVSIVNPVHVKGRMRRRGDTPTHLDVPGVSITTGVSLPGAKSPGNSDFKNRLRCAYSIEYSSYL